VRVAAGYERAAKENLQAGMTTPETITETPCHWHHIEYAQQGLQHCVTCRKPLFLKAPSWKCEHGAMRIGCSFCSPSEETLNKF
jgi:peptide methionine sulfoxide reductase MsrB